MFLEWLVRRHARAREGGRKVEFGANGWINPLDFDGLQGCGFTLRLLAGNLFNLVFPLGIHFQVHQVCKKSNAVLTAGSDVDHERLLGGPAGALDGEGVCAGTEVDHVDANPTQVRRPVPSLPRWSATAEDQRPPAPFS